MTDLPDPNDIASLSIAELERRIDGASPPEPLMRALAEDPRAGVKALAQRIKKAEARRRRLDEKQQHMLAIERAVREHRGAVHIAGVDEAGRGPLAGPVCAAAVILPQDADLPGLDDSKKLTAKKREEFYLRITECAVSWAAEFADNGEIDDLGILEATMAAMRRALVKLDPKPSVALIDGNRPPGAGICEERAVVSGDSQSLTVAAASVIAKVTRDRFMAEQAAVYPEYGFEGHKGYGAESHIAALRKHGPCPLHRFSFRIVPDVSPPGTVAEVLGERLRTASNRERFEQMGAVIARLKEHIHEHDLALLRRIYRERLESIRTGGRKIGERGEEAAANYLAHQGYTIVGRNWHAPCGYELDIIADDDGCLVFCEVKTAMTNRFGNPSGWVTDEKIARIAQAAEEYLYEHGIENRPCRFDVLGLRESRGMYDIDHIKGAFTAPDTDDDYLEDDERC